MKGSISFATGYVTTVLLNISGMGILETLLFAFIGGMAGYLGKLFVEWGFKKLKNLL